LKTCQHCFAKVERFKKDRHGPHCKPLEATGKYRYPKANGKFYCMLCIKPFKSPKSVAAHYVKQHLDSDLNRIGYSKMLLQCYWNGGDHMPQLMPVEEPAPVVRGIVPTQYFRNKREKNFDDLMRGVQVEFQMMLRYCMDGIGVNHRLLPEGPFGVEVWDKKIYLWYRNEYWNGHYAGLAGLTGTAGALNVVQHALPDCYLCCDTIQNGSQIIVFKLMHVIRW